MTPFPWALLKPYTGRFVRLGIVITLGAVAEAAGLVLLSGLLNIFLNNRGGGMPSVALLAPVYQLASERPSMFLLLLVAVYVAKSMLAIAGTYGSFSLAQGITRDWQRRLVRGFLTAPLGRLDTRQGSMVQIVLDEPGSAALGLGAAGLLAQNVLSTLTVYAVLLYVSFSVTIGLTVLALAAVAMVVALSRLSTRFGHQRFEIFKGGYGHLTELASAIKQFRALGLESKAEAASAAHFSEMAGIQVKMNVVSAAPRLLIELLFLFGLAAAVVVLVPRMGDPAVLSGLGLAVMATVRLLPSFATSASTWVQVNQSRPSIMHIAAELDRLERLKASVQDRPTGRPVVFHDDIAIEGVHFAYPGRAPALNGATLDIRHGAFTAIAGPSGSGKSTLIDLLCGFYEADQGRLAVDGIDLCEVDLHAWRRQLGVVLQDSFLVNGTIRENLCLLRPDCPEDLLTATVALVGADAMIRDLPGGYDTIVGDRGVGLSGGQRQRLALARVLLREPAVLILDEAMSALDVESEEALQERLVGLRGRMTLIVISHRLSVLRRADHIYVLDGGRVVEHGAHDALLVKDGMYAAMLRTSQISLA